RRGARRRDRARERAGACGGGRDPTEQPRARRPLGDLRPQRSERGGPAGERVLPAADPVPAGDREAVGAIGGWAAGLFPGEVGGALLDERQDALHEVLGVALLALSLGLGLELTGEVRVHAAVEQVLRAGVGGRRPIRE